MKIIGREETAKRAEFLRTQKLKKKKKNSEGNRIWQKTRGGLNL